MASSVNYNSLEYNIEDLEYPTNLSSEEFAGHRVLFLINVVSESKFRNVVDGAATDVFDIPPGEYRQNAGQRTADKVKEVTSGVEKAINNYTGANVSLSPSSVSKRLKVAISLHMPTELNFNYGTQWGEEDLSKSENVAELFNDLVAGNVKAGATDFIGRKMMETARRNSAIINATRQTPGNAKAEQIFQGVDFRTFNFTYDFAPRDIKEAQNALNITRMFKHHMLPEYKDNDQFLFIYPSEFDIKYFYGSAENENLDKHFTAVLKNCSVNYAPNGQFSTFKGTGIPTQFRMTLTFQELSVPTKETTPWQTNETAAKNNRSTGANIRAMK